MPEKLIALENMPDKMRVKVEDSFRKNLFERSLNKVKKVIVLAKELNCHTDTTLKLRKGQSFIKIKHLKKLSELSNISLDIIEKHILELRTRDRKREVKIKLPIFTSPELASLIGHCMGDGCLSEKQFSFFNLQRELVDEVIKDVKRAFSTNVKPIEFEKDDGWEIEFPTNIARLIALSGGPVGEKVFLPFDVPEWIKNGNDKIKIAFIRALFDDESWIKIKFIRQSSSTQRIIGINMSKNKKFIESHKHFFENIRNILLELSITPSKVTEMGKTKNGINLGIIISDIINLHRFLQVIGFSHVEKREKLINSLSSSRRFNELFPNDRVLFELQNNINPNNKI